MHIVEAKPVKSNRLLELEENNYRNSLLIEDLMSIVKGMKQDLEGFKKHTHLCFKEVWGIVK